MAQSNKDNHQKFSPAEKIVIAALIFLAIMILGFLLMLLTGRMVLPF